MDDFSVDGERSADDGGDDFAPSLFGLSHREASSVAPRRRALMMAAWEALEHAGLPPRRVERDRPVLFLGAENCGTENFGAGDGAESSGTEGRGARPPDERLPLGAHVAPVTICPSSLAAVRTAGESLQRGECRTALAAVTVPETDGDRAPGCVVIVLRALADAHRDGDRVLAVVDSCSQGPRHGASDPTGPDTGLAELLHAVLALRHQERETVLTHADGRLLVGPAPASDTHAPAGPGPVPPSAPPSPEAPSRPSPPSPAEAAALLVFPLSNTSPAGLRADARRLADLVASPRAPRLADTAWTLARHRAHLAERAVVVAGDRAELEAGLRAVAAGKPAPGVATGRPLGAGHPGVVWVFSGDGSQWTGMGRESLVREPAFAAFLDEVDPVFRAEGGYSPRELLTATDVGAVPCGRLQGICFAMQAALARVWRDRGLEPAAVIGHSGGEIAAAVAAGALSPADGALLVCRRSALLPRVAGAGAMALVDLPPAEVDTALKGRSDVVVGIRASAVTTVVSGDADAVERLAREWTEQGRFVRPVATDLAPHSPHMDPLLDEVRAALAVLEPRAPRTPLYSTSLADPRARAPFDAHYWAGNLRNTVRFDAAVAAAAEDGHRVFLEISGHPLVTQSVRETLTAHGVGDAVVLPTLLRHRPEQRTLLTQLGALHCHGVRVDLTARDPGGRLVDLPARAWRRPVAGEPAEERAGDSYEEPAGDPAGGRPPGHGTGKQTDWRRLDPDELTRALTALVRDVVTEQLALGAAEVDPRRPLAEYGMESLQSLAIKRRLSDHLGLPLPATLLWNHPTVAEVAAALTTRLGRGAAPRAPRPAEGTLVPAGPPDPPGPKAPSGSSASPVSPASPALSGFELLLRDVESDGDAL
ncbi:acyltransferase domain-containing protein [Streptomyces sp. URMC 123]|uniref:acyltransferase domain-containing protein n=1 Tax=Streptomyces sp. URMC 123 TaxID=3423403 RepID=UPI003F1A27F7